MNKAKNKWSKKLSIGIWIITSYVLLVSAPIIGFVRNGFDLLIFLCVLFGQIPYVLMIVVYFFIVIEIKNERKMQ